MNELQLCGFIENNEKEIVELFYRKDVNGNYEIYFEGCSDAFMIYGLRELKIKPISKIEFDENKIKHLSKEYADMVSNLQLQSYGARYIGLIALDNGICVIKNDYPFEAVYGTVENGFVAYEGDADISDVDADTVEYNTLISTVEEYSM